MSTTTIEPRSVLDDQSWMSLGGVISRQNKAEQFNALDYLKRSLPPDPFGLFVSRLIQQKAEDSWNRPIAGVSDNRLINDYSHELEYGKQISKAISRILQSLFAHPDGEQVQSDGLKELLIQELNSDTSSRACKTRTELKELAAALN